MGPNIGSRRHESSGFLVPHADIADAVRALAHRLDDRIDSIADDPESVRRAPGDQGFDDDVGSIQLGPKFRRGLRDSVGSGFGWRSLRRSRARRGGEPRTGGDHLKEISPADGGFFGS
jgi:hypothetical protein